MGRTVYVVAFKPQPGERQNSAEITSNLLKRQFDRDHERDPDTRLVFLPPLPVDWTEAPKRLRAIVRDKLECGDQCSSNVLIVLGESAAAQQVTMEVLGRNATSARSRDSAGNVNPSGTVLDSSESSQNVRICPLLARTRQKLEPLPTGTAWSSSAGDYLCNTMAWHGYGYRDSNIVFVHVPTKNHERSATHLDGLVQRINQWADAAQL